MNGSSRLQPGPLRKTPAQGSMRPPVRHGTSSSRNPSLLSSPAPSMSAPRSRAGTVSPRKASVESQSQNEPNNEANINVIVRCRGRSEREKSENSNVVVSHPSTTEVALALGPLASVENKLYTFDRTFGPDADQQRIYDNVVAPLLNEVLDGFNCTIFAYGQTGTGKTYTMTGDMSDQFGTYADFAGIIPRVLYKLFEKLRKLDHGDKSVKCSFIELYNEELRDLLACDESQKVKIFDAANGKGGVVVQGMEETFIMSATQGVSLLQAGSHKRQVAATKCNDLSSRSHTVFTITVGVRDTGEDGEVFIRSAKLNLVDLAGSESVGRSGAENKRAREAGMINQSLLTLGRVINALVDKSSHIPYRESKLTRLLQDSLGGRTKTTIIATISPAKMNLEETMSTLDYASRAKNIQNKPQVNQMLNKKTVIAEFVADIERLKSALHASRLKNGIYMSQEDPWNSKKNEVEEAKREEELLHGQITRLRENFEHTMRELLDTKTSLEEQIQHLEETKEILKSTELDLTKATTKLEEETIIRKAHQKTERELSIAGNDLISTARSTTSDIDLLRAKIGRMANVEVENHTIWMKSSSRVKQATEEVEATVATFAKEQENLSEKISDRISVFVELETTELQKAYDFVEERLAKFETAKQQGDSNLEASKDEMNSVLEEIKVLREDIKTRIGDGLKGLNNAAKRMSNDVITDLGKFGSELRQSYDRFDQGFKTMVSEAQKYMIAQKSEIEHISRELSEATVIASTATATAQSNLQTILVEERERALKDRQNLIVQITTLINNTADEQDKRLTERIETVQKEIGATQTQLKAASKVHEEGMESWSTREENFYSRLCDAKETVRCVLAQDWQNVESRNSTIQDITKSIHAQTITLVEKQTEDVGVQMQALDEFVARARSQNESHHKTSLQSLQDLYGGGREFVENFSGLITRFRDELQSIEEVSGMASTGLDAFSSFSQSTQQRLSELRGNVESESLKECLPTSQTPRKRKYTFPTTLPSTGSAEEVLARARGETVRPVLGEKEVNSPHKQIPSAPSILTDPKSGGAGIGAAFYPTVTKKKVLRDIALIAGEPADDRGLAESNMKLKENSIFTLGDDTASRRRSLRKRKASDPSDMKDGSEMTAITTRRRMR
ncbi:P-loop containing nucleoside triphosphate hydrolase protein [Trichophaea hybrida]|nr:P-loop containing nucleoside triphosphate hydrolase protein [Trichophaea hybrida]